MQDYTSKPTIDGVSIVTLKNMSGEDSDFSELLRINPQGESEQFPGFHVAQINRSTQIPGSVKAWHIHFAQDELCVRRRRITTHDGAMGCPKKFPHVWRNYAYTYGGKLSSDGIYSSKELHMERNFSSNIATIMYFMNGQFNLNNPDERRIPWDSHGKEFWEPQRD